MILSGREIHNRIGEDIEIDPFDPNQLNPNSYNSEYVSSAIDPNKPTCPVVRAAISSVLFVGYNSSHLYSFLIFLRKRGPTIYLS